MSYYGTTQSATAQNPPRLVGGGAMYVNRNSSALTTPGSTQTFAAKAPNAQGGQMWYYLSTNLTTDVTAANFFSDGYKLGMRPGDLVHCVHYSSLGSTVHFSIHVVATVNSTSGAASLNSTSNAAYFLASTRASSI